MGTDWVVSDTFSTDGAWRLDLGHSPTRFTPTGGAAYGVGQVSLIIGGTAKQTIRIRRGLGLLGDSFSANCHTIAATAYGTEAYGYAGTIAAKTGLFPHYRDNQGKVGDHTGQFMARLPGALASTTADLWMLLSRTNDSTTTNMTLADSKANVMKIITAFENIPGST